MEHGHSHIPMDRGGRRLLLSLVAIVTILIVEIIGGLVSGSLALLSDAGHMAVDALALIIGYVAIRLGSRPPDGTNTYGYRRVEILAALANGILLVIIVGSIVIHAVGRLFVPRPIEGEIMTLTAVLGLIGNLVALVMLHGVRHHTHNIRAAFFHVLADTLSSVGVIVAGIVILTTGWTLIDPLMSLIIAVVIFRQVMGVIHESIQILLEGVPPHIKHNDVAASISRLQEVKNVHDLHITTHVGGQYVLTAHVVLDDMPLESALDVVAEIRELVGEKFGIHHATIEIDTDATSKGVQDRLYCEHEPQRNS